MTAIMSASDSNDASRHEIEAMACVLEGRHGVHAAEVAEFFATAHVISDDADRGRAWSQVASLVRQREVRRFCGMVR